MEGSVKGARVGGGGGGGTGAQALPLPAPPRLAAISSSPASIRALLARTASGNGVADCQSPRSLLSRILQRGDGGNGGFGCRVRLPRRYSSSGGGREERKDGAEQAAATPRVKVVERAPELPVETPRSSLGKKKPEDELMSMNFGLGASLVLLLSKSAVELNKMVELRAQVEALASEIRKETMQRKEKDSASSSSQESNGSNTTTTAVIKDPIACAASEDALSNCSRTAGCDVRDNPAPGRTVVAMDQMEAELQVELSRLQCAAHGEKRITPMQGLELPSLQIKTKSTVSDSTSRSCVDDDDGVAEGSAEEEEAVDGEEEESEEEEEQGYDVEKSPPHGGVSARALERRLHELLQKRQQERIVELESALDSAQRRLHEKERELVWWRDAAKLVSHRRDESRRLR